MIAEGRTSRVAPNGRSKWRRVSKNQTVSIVIFTLTWKFLAVLWFGKTKKVSEYALSSCCKEIIAGKTGIGGAIENIPIEEVFKQLKCTREGLSTEKGEKRLQIFGFNKLEEAQLFLDFFISY
ncbi:hypothetical protein RHGRI_028957 [Rhododendron griersonianum]|uniref:Cation-transporting P-type ATPase N-terminal domain-containing protein n=1 Tax=Rhododendron griersonianum TaxID=479676 RepID=A0AAV6IHP1_9ERIC|nr:hypothetical protein RHGRI_028957 [Rhododendron griersonianum]